MITREEYNLAYNLYMADKTLQEQDCNRTIKSMTESTAVLQEDAKTNIQNFLTKIMNGIQEAWNKYKENVANTKLKYNNDDITRYINDFKCTVEVENFVTYDTDYLNNKISTINTDVSTMERDDITSRDKFLNTYCSDYYKDANKSVYDNIKDKIITKSNEEKHTVTKEELQAMHTFTMHHKDSVNEMEKEIKSLNKMSEDDYAYIANHVVSGGATANAPAPNNRETAANESYIREADDDKPTVVNNTGENKEDSNSGGGVGSENDNSNDASAEKIVEVSFKCNTEILSAKMKLNRDIFFFYNSVINSHVANCKREEAKKPTKAPKEDNTNKADNGAPQAEV